MTKTPRDELREQIKAFAEHTFAWNVSELRIDELMEAIDTYATTLAAQKEKE